VNTVIGYHKNTSGKKAWHSGYTLGENMRVIHCLLDLTIGSLDFIAEKLNFRAKRKSLLKKARRSQIPLYGCWYVDGLDHILDEDHFIDPAKRLYYEFLESVIGMIKEHPEDAALIISIWISGDIPQNKETEKAAPLRTWQEFHEFIVVYQYIKTGCTDEARELLERSLGGEKAKDILNCLGRQ